MIEINPMKVTTGATFIRRALKIPGSNIVSVEPLPLIKINPITTMAIPTANIIKLVFPKAKFLLSIFFEEL